MSEASLEARQARIIATVQELRALDVPEPVLAPLLRFACVEMWSEEAAPPEHTRFDSDYIGRRPA